jgi:two-component system, OmpR family, response regulator CpxR
VGSIVLVADADGALCSLLCDFLEDEGRNARAVRSGGEALAQLISGAPDAILLGNRLSDMTSAAFARRYHATPLPHAPIVLLTTSLDPQREAAELGAAAHLVKPFDLNRLIAVLAELSSDFDQE